MGNNIISRIKILRGPRNSFPNLSDGEFAFATDTNELFIGYDSEAIKIATQPLIEKHEEEISHIKNDIHYFHDKEKELIYNIQVGGDNLISNGNFYFPLDEAKNIGMNLIGDTNEGADIFYEDISDLGIGSDKCLTIINRKPFTTGVSFSIIDLNKSVEAINSNFILQYWSRYQYIMPGENIDFNLCKLGEVKVIYEYSDGTTETEIYKGEVVYTGSKGWHKNVFRFQINPTKQTVRVYASVYFYFNDCIGDISITGVKVEYGDVATGIHMPDKDILYISKCLDDKIQKTILDTEKNLKLLSNSIKDINKNIDKINNDVALINSKISNVDYIPKNRLRNSGEFSSNLYWKNSNNYFTFNIKNRLMRLVNKTNTISHIDIETAESMYMNKAIAISIVFVDNRNDIDNTLDVRLRDREKDVFEIQDYTIEKYDVDMKKYVAIIEPHNDIINAIEYLSIYNTDFLLDDSISIKYLRMSYYMRDTEWYPCPEDTIYSFNDYNNSITEMQESMSKMNASIYTHTTNLNKVNSLLGDSEMLNGIVTETNLINLPLGTYIKNESVLDILNKILFRTKTPEVTDIELYDINGAEITDENQSGEYIYVYDIILRYRSYGEEMKSVTLYIGDDSVYECTLEPDEEYATYKFGGNLRLGKTMDFKCVLTTIENVSYEMTRTIKFIPPIYYGSTDKDIESINQGYITNSKIMPAKYDMNKISLLFNHKNSKVFACIPNVVIDEISAIRDSNCINYLDSFDTKPIRMLFDEHNRNYTLYVMKHNTEMDNVTLDFIKKGGVM